jgi:hypothetical protein
MVLLGFGLFAAEAASKLGGFAAEFDDRGTQLATEDIALSHERLGLPPYL